MSECRHARTTAALTLAVCCGACAADAHRLPAHGFVGGTEVETTVDSVPGGATLVEMGLDHYMSAPDIDRRTEALTRTVLRLIAERGAVHAREAMANSHHE